ncbi:MAG TPA: glycosyltransferase family 2 protein [Solirubrobacterales bacterium]|jgi:hypothetical protein
MKLAMTLIVRDEADIVEDNLRYHRAQGVDLFVVLDNGSTDGTLEILERYERAGALTLLRRPGNMLTIQRKGNTEIARLAHELGADWVFHNDADEFWWPYGGADLKETFERIPESQGVVLIPRTEFIPRPDGHESFAERLTIRESRFLRPPKTAHRTHPQVKLWTTHPIDLWVKREEPPRSGLVGKPSLRTQATHREEHELDLVLAPEFPIGALHFPLRSFEQYRKKMAIADHNKMWGRNEETRALHEAYRAGRLEEVFENLLLDDRTVEAGLAEGWLVEDTDFRDYLRACPGVLDDGEAPSGSSAWPRERREAALAELREDGMYAISRYMQTVASKKRKRHLDARELKKLRAQVKESKQELRAVERRTRRLERRSRRLERVERSRWWRIRPRLPARRRRDH